MIIVPMTVAISDVSVSASVASDNLQISASILLNVTALPAYEGAIEFTPTTEEQTIPTANTSVFDDITIAPIPQNYVDTSDADAVEDDIAEGKTAWVNGVKLTGTGSKGGAVIKTGTITGSGTIQLQIPCEFAPDLIYVFGNLSADMSLRGVVSITIVKDGELIFTADASTSATLETMSYSSHEITGYNTPENPHATYSDGVLTIDTVNNTSSYRFNSAVTYSYKLVGF